MAREEAWRHGFAGAGHLSQSTMSAKPQTARAEAKRV